MEKEQLEEKFRKRLFSHMTTGDQKQDLSSESEGSHGKGKKNGPALSKMNTLASIGANPLGATLFSSMLPRNTSTAQSNPHSHTFNRGTFAAPHNGPEQLPTQGSQNQATSSQDNFDSEKIDDQFSVEEEKSNLSRQMSFFTSKKRDIEKKKNSPPRKEPPGSEDRQRE